MSVIEKIIYTLKKVEEVTAQGGGTGGSSSGFPVPNTKINYFKVPLTSIQYDVPPITFGADTNVIISIQE